MKIGIVSFVATMLVFLGVRWLVVDHRWERGNGQHNGYITAVECKENGLIDRYCTVYFKTDQSSSQEDEYYTDLNSPLLPQLREAQDTGKHVVLEYTAMQMRGFRRPDGDYVRGIEYK